MRRFYWVLCIICFLSASAARADLPEKLSPPLNGDMTTLKVYDKPQKLSQVILGSIAGRQVDLASFTGKIVLLNVWATWCPPCIKELPSLNALQFSMDPQRFKVVNVSLDSFGADQVQTYLTEHNLATLTPYVDSNSQVQGLEILNKAPGIPISILIDPQNRALAVYQGDADWNGKAARAVIDYYAGIVSYAPFDPRTFM